MSEVNVCWIEGNYHYREDIIKKIVNKLDNPKIIRVNNLDGINAIHSMLCFEDFFVNKKVVILNEMLRFYENSQKNNTKWKKIIQNITKNNILIFNNISNTKYKSIFNCVKKYGKVFEGSLYLKKSDMGDYVNNILSDFDKTIDENVFEQIHHCFVNAEKGILTDSIYLTLKKICHYMGGKNKVIKQEHILPFILDSEEFVSWNMFDALDSFNYDKCLKFFSDMQRNKSITNAIEEFMPLLAWRYRLLLVLKDEQAVEKSNSKIIEKIQKISNKEGDKPLYSDRVIKSFLEGRFNSESPLKFYSRKELYNINKYIHEAMLIFRYDNNSINKKFAFEMLLMMIYFRKKNLSGILSIWNNINERRKIIS